MITGYKYMDRDFKYSKTLHPAPTTQATRPFRSEDRGPRPLRAMFYKIQDDGTLAIKGPLTPQRARNLDADYIEVLASYEELHDPKNAEDLKALMNCLSASTMDANPLDQIATVGYVIGTVASMKLKNFDFDRVSYEGF